MSDILELSSDSNDTIICQTDEYVFNGDLDVQDVVNKYISENHAENSNSLNVDEERFWVNNVTSGSDDKKLKASDKLLSASSSSQDDDINISNIEHDAILQQLSAKYKQIEGNNFDENVSKKDKETKKREKEIQKQHKIQERERKKKEAEQEKALKQALAAANKHTKPTECLKFVIVNIDNEIVNKDFGMDIINCLQTAEIQYNVQPQIFPCTISWTRKVESHFMDDEGKLTLSLRDQETDQILLIMTCKELLEHVSNNTLSGYIQSLNSMLTNKKFTLAIYGLQAYLRYQKKTEFREQVTNKKPRHSHSFEDFPKVSRKNIEYALTELQLLHSCSHRVLKASSEVGLMVTQFTKSIAEIPFKLQRREKYQQTDWFAAGDNRDCVKVDKDGNGLHRLWRQMLTIFPLARLETAEAISSKYPTISSVMKAYESCVNTNQAELLLQDIPIRRAAGPLSSTRKIGPELSKKIHNFFTSADGEALL